MYFIMYAYLRIGYLFTDTYLIYGGLMYLLVRFY